MDRSGIEVSVMSNCRTPPHTHTHTHSLSLSLSHTHTHCFLNFSRDTKLLICQGNAVCVYCILYIRVCVCAHTDCILVHSWLRKCSSGRRMYFMDMASNPFVPRCLFMGPSLTSTCNGIIQLLTPESSGKICDFKFCSATDIYCLSILTF